MCLMLYLAAASDVPATKNESISVELVKEDVAVVAQWFSFPTIRFIGARGCSCSFPHVLTDEPIEWFEGMFDESEDREEALASVRALLDLLRDLLAVSPEVELFPVWAGDEAEPPEGTIVLEFEALEPEKFFFNEQFFYRIVLKPPA